jgi:hypothetical protein
MDCKRPKAKCPEEMPRKRVERKGKKSQCSLNLSPGEEERLLFYGLSTSVCVSLLASEAKEKKDHDRKLSKSIGP